MSLLLKKLNQASAQKAADEHAEKAAAQEGAQPQQPATAAPATPPTPATPPVAPAPATTAAQQPPQQPAQPTAAPTLSTPPTATVAKQTTPPPATPSTPAQPATPPAPAQSAPGSIGLKPKAPPAAPSAPPPAPVAAKPAPAAPVAPGSIGLKSAAPPPTPAPVAKPAPGAAGVQPATTPPPAPTLQVAPAAPQPSATGVQLATAAMVDEPKPQPKARKLSQGLRAADYFSKARGVVSAARVLGAQSSDKGPKWQKFAVGAAVAIVVIGGGLYASSFLGLFGDGGIVGGGVARGPATQQTASAQEGVVIEALPSPVIDVQAQIAAIDSLRAEEAVVELTVSGEEAIAAYEIVPDVQYSEEEWSLIEREEREFAEEEEQKIAVIAASDPVGVDTELDIAIQLESQRDSINVRDDKISVRADDAVKVEGRAEIKSSDKAQRRADKLLQAANFYAAGRYERAGRVYGEVLDESPANLQALRGSALAAAAMRRYKTAADFHVRILKLFPDDPFAVAELSNLGGIKPAEVERLLKKLIGKTPAIDGRLYFALGNVYAASSRWHRARDAFGEALTREQNPDYAYNLAVAMEYLRKPGLAAHYYRQALQMTKGSVAAGFDADKVRARIAVLDA